MRVGFDMRILRQTRGGTAVYAQNLLAALRERYPDDEFITLDSNLRLPRANAVTKVGNALADIYYLNILLPLQAWRARVDIVHFPGNMVSTRLHCPSVVTIHDMMVARLPDAYDPLFLKFFNFFVPGSARRAGRVITDSEFSKADISHYLGVPPEKIAVTHLGVAPGFAPRDRQEAKAYLAESYGLDSRPIILFAGELNGRKNVMNLVRAFAQLRKQHPEALCRLVLAGEQRDQEYCRRLQECIEQERITDDVRIVGYLPAGDLPIFYAAADVFAFVSLLEGFGLPAVEAMASGVPVVTSNISSLPEVVGDAAVLVDPYSVPSIAEGLRAALMDKALRERLIANGYKRAGMFRWEHTAAATYEVYRQVLESSEYRVPSTEYQVASGEWRVPGGER
jgi:glycosyltransferase involved in cell wall biosynthesis